MQSRIEPQLTQEAGRAIWRAMFAEISGRQLLVPTAANTVFKMAILSPLLGIALALSWSQGSGWVLAASYVGIALLLAQFAFVGHDAGHGAISRAGLANRTVGQFAMTFVTGLAFDEWMGRHLAHHRHCQEEDRDPDMAVEFVVSLTEESKRRKGALGRFLTRYQGIHIWILSLFFGHSQRHLSQAAVLAHPRRHPFDAAVLPFHVFLWFGVPCLLLDVPFLQALLAYVIPLTLLGPYLAAIFWVNHVGMPLIGKPADFSFFEHQVVTSRTIVNPPAWNWLFGGLNFQIEHHLFPGVPSNRLPIVQSIVRAHFEKNRIEYHGVSWASAIVSIGKHLHRIARAA